MIVLASSSSPSSFVYFLVIVVLVSAAIPYTHAQFSGTCLAENNRLANGLSDVKFTTLCNIGVGFSCEVDTDDLVQSRPFVDRCYELGGQIFWYNEMWTCVDSFSTYTYSFLDLMYCLGTTCSQADLNWYLQNVYKPDKVKKISVDGKDCSISFEDVLRTTLSGKCAAEDLRLIDAIDIMLPEWSLPSATGSTVDFLETTVPYKTACLSSGGEIYIVDQVHVNCTVFIDGVPGPYTATLLNDPYCFGASCSLTDVEAEIAAIFDPRAEAYIRLADDRYVCTVTSGAATKLVPSSTETPPVAIAPVPATPTRRPTSNRNATGSHCTGSGHPRPAVPRPTLELYNEHHPPLL
jgi:hypothetical protein